MKKIIRIFASFLVICMTMCALPVNAVEPVQYSSDMASRIQSILSEPKASNETVWYVVKDKVGNDISDRFESSLNNFQGLTALSNAAQPVDLNDISYFAKVVESTFIAMNSDIAKSQTVEAVEALTGVISLSSGPQNVTLHVEYKLTGTVYYNPNTYRISSTQGPRRSGLRFSLQNNDNPEGITFGTTNVSSNVAIASNKLSATFNHSNKIVGNQGAYVVDFGYIDTSFTIYAG